MSQDLCLHCSKKVLVIVCVKDACWMLFHVLSCSVQFVDTFCLPNYLGYIFTQLCVYSFCLWHVRARSVTGKGFPTLLAC